MSRFCKDCRHFSRGFGSYYGPECVRPVGDVSLVSGLPRGLCASAWNERKPGKTLFTRRERCGPDGKYFEPEEG